MTTQNSDTQNTVAETPVKGVGAGELVRREYSLPPEDGDYRLVVGCNAWRDILGTASTPKAIDALSRAGIALHFSVINGSVVLHGSHVVSSGQEGLQPNKTDQQRRTETP